MTVNHVVPRSSRGGGAKSYTLCSFFRFTIYAQVLIIGPPVQVGEGEQKATHLCSFFRFTFYAQVLIMGSPVQIGNGEQLQ